MAARLQHQISSQLFEIDSRNKDNVGSDGATSLRVLPIRNPGEVSGRQTFNEYLLGRGQASSRVRASISEPHLPAAVLSSVSSNGRLTLTQDDFSGPRQISLSSGICVRCFARFIQPFVERLRCIICQNSVCSSCTDFVNGATCICKVCQKQSELSNKLQEEISKRLHVQQPVLEDQSSKRGSLFNSNDTTQKKPKNVYERNTYVSNFDEISADINEQLEKQWNRAEQSIPQPSADNSSLIYSPRIRPTSPHQNHPSRLALFEPRDSSVESYPYHSAESVFLKDPIYETPSLMKKAKSPETPLFSRFAKSPNSLSMENLNIFPSQGKTLRANEHNVNRSDTKISDNRDQQSSKEPRALEENQWKVAEISTDFYTMEDEWRFVESKTPTLPLPHQSTGTRRLLESAETPRGRALSSNSIDPRGLLELDIFEEIEKGTISSSPSPRSKPSIGEVSPKSRYTVVHDILNVGKYDLAVDEHNNASLPADSPSTSFRSTEISGDLKEDNFDRRSGTKLAAGFDNHHSQMAHNDVIEEMLFDTLESSKLEQTMYPFFEDRNKSGSSGTSPRRRESSEIDEARPVAEEQILTPSFHKREIKFSSLFDKLPAAAEPLAQSQQSILSSFSRESLVRDSVDNKQTSPADSGVVTGDLDFNSSPFTFPSTTEMTNNNEQHYGDAVLQDSADQKEGFSQLFIDDPREGEPESFIVVKEIRSSRTKPHSPKKVVIKDPLSIEDFEDTATANGNEDSEAVNGQTADPKFTSRPSNISILEGEPAVFECQVDGTKPLDVFWYRDGKSRQSLDSDERCDLTVDEAERKHSLQMFNISTQDAGNYLAVVVNNKGSARTSFSLNISENSNEMKEPCFLRELDEISVAEGACVTFRCKLEGYPQPRVQWYKDEKKISRNSRIDMRKCGNRDCILMLDFVCDYDKGTYTVVASNNAGEATSSASLAVEKVLAKAKKTAISRSNEELFRWSACSSPDYTFFYPQFGHESFSEGIAHETNGNTTLIEAECNTNEVLSTNSSENRRQTNEESAGRGPKPLMNGMLAKRALGTAPEMSSIKISPSPSAKVASSPISNKNFTTRQQFSPDDDVDPELSFEDFNKLYDAGLLTQSQLRTRTVKRRDLAELLSYLRGVKLHGKPIERDYSGDGSGMRQSGKARREHQKSATVVNVVLPTVKKTPAEVDESSDSSAASVGALKKMWETQSQSNRISRSHRTSPFHQPSKSHQNSNSHQVSPKSASSNTSNLRRTLSSREPEKIKGLKLSVYQNHSKSNECIPNSIKESHSRVYRSRAFAVNDQQPTLSSSEQNLAGDNNFYYRPCEENNNRKDSGGSRHDGIDGEHAIRRGQVKNLLAKFRSLEGGSGDPLNRASSFNERDTKRTRVRQPRTFVS